MKIGSHELDALNSALGAATDPEDRARLEVHVKHLQAYVFSRVSPFCEHIPQPTCRMPRAELNAAEYFIGLERSDRVSAEDHLAVLCVEVFDQLRPGSALRVWELFNHVREKCTMFDLPDDPAADQMGLNEVSSAYARAWLEGVVVTDDRFQLGRVDYVQEVGSLQIPARAALVRLRSDDPDWKHASGSSISWPVELLDAPELADLPVTTRGTRASSWRERS